MKKLNFLFSDRLLFITGAIQYLHVYSCSFCKYISDLPEVLNPKKKTKQKNPVFLFFFSDGIGPCFISGHTIMM